MSFIVNFEQISQINLEFPLLTLNKQIKAGRVRLLKIYLNCKSTKVSSVIIYHSISVRENVDVFFELQYSYVTCVLFPIMNKSHKTLQDRSSHRRRLQKRLQHKCFPVNIAKFLRIPILENICERLLLYAPEKKHLTFSSSHQGCSIKKVFFCEFCEISRNTFFTEHPLVAASAH